MSLGVLAMRLRLALLRQKVNVDSERLMGDADYAAVVADLCRTIGGDLASLSEQFVQQRNALQPAPAEPPPQAAEPPRQSKSMRFAMSRPASVDTTTTGSEFNRSTMPASDASTVTGATGSATEPDRDDPDSPRNRRYLRGAR